MPESCPVCGFGYEVEVRFYWGAMYINYGLSVVLVILVGVMLYYLAHDTPTWVCLTVVTGVVLISTLFLFCYARGLMLYLFGSVIYDPRYNLPKS